MKRPAAVHLDPSLQFHLERDPRVATQYLESQRRTLQRLDATCGRERIHRLAVHAHDAVPGAKSRLVGWRAGVDSRHLERGRIDGREPDAIAARTLLPCTQLAVRGSREPQARVRRIECDRELLQDGGADVADIL